MYHIIVNPVSRSGRGMKIWKEVVEPAFQKDGAVYQAYFSQKAGDVAKLAAQIPNSVLVDSLEAAADWVKQNAREGDLVITLGCGDIYKASKMMVKKD